jgi:hypothetical protein
VEYKITPFVNRATKRRMTEEEEIEFFNNQLKCEEQKDLSLNGRSTDQLDNMAYALPTLRGLTCQFSINFFTETLIIILSHSEFMKYK